MNSKKVKILVFYRNLYENTPTIKERYTTTFIIDECYLLEFLPSLIREDIDRVMVEEYNRS